MKRSYILVLLTALSISGMANAAVTAQAQLSDLQASTFDLDRRDGVPAGITWGAGNTNVSVWLNDSLSGVTTSPYDSAPQADQPLSVSSSTVYGAGSANVSGGTMHSDVTTVQGSMAAGNAQGSSFGAVAWPDDWVSITIAPHTLVHFSALFDGSATTTLGFVNGSSTGEYANAYGNLMLWLPSLGGNMSYNSDATAYASFLSSWDQNTGTWSYSGQNSVMHTELNLFYVNNSDQAITGQFSAFVSANGSTPYDLAAPVPEPQTWALLLFGLVVTAAAARRREPNNSVR
jgi:hypothetical protein